MDHMNPLGEGADNWICDGMIASDHHGQAAARQDLLGHFGSAREAALDIGRSNISVTAVLNQAIAHLYVEVDPLRLRIVEAAFSENKTERMFSDRAWTETRASKEGRALIEGHTHYRDGAIELVEIVTYSRAKEGRNADEGSINALSSVPLGHDVPPVQWFFFLQ